MEDNILKDFEIYYAIKLLTGKIKLKYNKEDYELLGIYEVDERLKVKVKEYESNRLEAYKRL